MLCVYIDLSALQLSVQILIIKSSFNISRSHCMASNYLWTEGNILLPLGGGGGWTRKNLDIFSWGGGGGKGREPKKNGKSVSNFHPSHK